MGFVCGSEFNLDIIFSMLKIIFGSGANKYWVFLSRYRIVFKIVITSFYNEVKRQNHYLSFCDFSRILIFGLVL